MNSAIAVRMLQTSFENMMSRYGAMSTGSNRNRHRKKNNTTTNANNMNSTKDKRNSIDYLHTLIIPHNSTQNVLMQFRVVNNAYKKNMYKNMGDANENIRDTNSKKGDKNMCINWQWGLLGGHAVTSECKDDRFVLSEVLLCCFTYHL